MFGWNLLPAPPTLPGQGPFPVPSTCSSAWPYSTLYPSLCAPPLVPTGPHSLGVFLPTAPPSVSVVGLSSPSASVWVLLSLLVVSCPLGQAQQRSRRLPALAGVCLWATESPSTLSFPHSTYSPLRVLSRLMTFSSRPGVLRGWAGGVVPLFIAAPQWRPVPGTRQALHRYCWNGKEISTSTSHRDIPEKHVQGGTAPSSLRVSASWMAVFFGPRSPGGRRQSLPSFLPSLLSPDLSSCVHTRFTFS